MTRYKQTNQQGITQNTITIMYRVQGTMMESYYGDEVQQRKSNLVRKSIRTFYAKMILSFANHLA